MLQKFLINSRAMEMSHRHFCEYALLMIMMFYRSHLPLYVNLHLKMRGCSATQCIFIE